MTRCLRLCSSATGLVGLQEAISNAHYPPDFAAADRGRRRLAFDEILAFQLAILGRRRHREQDAVGTPVKYHQAVVDGLLTNLPFSPTAAQLRCIAEILADMARGTPPMSRLLQGEVGSGKTLVALAAVLAAASARRQSALMAPTEVLAEQHFATVCRLLDSFDQPLQQPNVTSAYFPQMPRPFTVGLLTGSTRAAPRREVLRMGIRRTPGSPGRHPRAHTGWCGVVEPGAGDNRRTASFRRSPAHRPAQQRPRNSPTR